MQLVLQQCVVCIGTLWIDLFDFECQLRGEKQSFCHISTQVGYQTTDSAETVKDFLPMRLGLWREIKKELRST